MLYCAPITASLENSTCFLGVDFAAQFYFESPYMVTFVTSTAEGYTIAVITQQEETNEQRNNATAPSQDT
jgi:hypothetical protein